MKGIEVTRTSAHCESDWHAFYHDVTDRRREVADAVPFSFMTQAFVTFACIGKAEGEFAPLKVAREIFIAPSLNRELHVPVLVAIAYEHLVNQGTTPEEAIATASTSGGFMPIVEGYAQGGAGFFKANLERSGLPASEWFANYVGKRISALL